ncbi:ABC-type Fe3+/spermidine/putrescine transport system ATPase subunit [Bacillus thermophilus]|uniref:ABC-type Fe3+/spermidine/putrescine transport system ATPase subunit n=1 Tax=Siminovitchia thermophila TaxID=1245522 RepID=A0ABS2R4C7_9BACI|nr:ABC-type Fe3+/spermidine/putrescine transport system ATPase subunit [Siminovitchia thermophila]
MTVLKKAVGDDPAPGAIQDHPPERPMVSYQAIRKSFGETEVLKGIDLHIKPGEKITIIGPSGSGKTTIIRMLMTLEEPISGVIEVDGEPLWHKEVNGRLVPG